MTLTRRTFSHAAALVLVSTSASLVAGGFASGPKLTGTGSVGAAGQGLGVALSANGDTALVGAPNDAAGAGAVWVHTRAAGVWTQQGSKLVGTGASGAANQGSSAALSSDGDTALAGARADDGGAGAAWVFIRSNGVWTQQGAKLVGTGASGAAARGVSVALSADGSTAAVGGSDDASGAGAVWIFTRTAGIWTQQGTKLVGSGAVGAANQGSSVALSADGDTLIVGGNSDNASVGAAWVFTRSAGSWSQQGTKLVGAGNAGGSQQGWAVALSADGNTAGVGGYADDTNVGATWVFTRSAGVWSPQGGKLVGTGAVGGAFQGESIAFSSDGNTLVAGGERDNTFIGAGWVFRRTNGAWAQDGEKLVGPGFGGLPHEGSRATISGDGRTVMLGGLNDSSGIGAAWIFQRTCLGGDVNGDGLLTVTDVFYTINFLFAGGAAPSCY